MKAEPHPLPTPGASASDDLVAALDAELEPRALAALLDVPDGAVAGRLWEQALGRPARDFLARPGKRVRARLVEHGYALAGGRGAPPASLGQVVEILHAGSLIVDDIEDGASERRGAPALHRAFGVALALNTGNWMYYWPAQLVARLGLTPEAELAVRRDIELTMYRCHHGQALDLSVRVVQLRRHEVAGVALAVSRLKTGSLLELAARLGARAAGAAEPRVVAIGAFGRAMGVGLQMLDDLSSVACAARLAKGSEDLRHGRTTWPWAWTAEVADEASFFRALAAQRELAAAREPDAWALLPHLAAELARFAEPVGRARAHELLDAAAASLGAACGAGRALDILTADLARLEASYG